MGLSFLPSILTHGVHRTSPLCIVGLGTNCVIWVLFVQSLMLGHVMQFKSTILHVPPTGRPLHKYGLSLLIFSAVFFMSSLCTVEWAVWIFNFGDVKTQIYAFECNFICFSCELVRFDSGNEHDWHAVWHANFGFEVFNVVGRWGPWHILDFSDWSWAPGTLYCSVKAVVACIYNTRLVRSIMCKSIFVRLMQWPIYDNYSVARSRLT